jgi:DNA-binding MarR family transcriptional regulator
MKKHSIIDLPADYALVLQQIKENGQENFVQLLEALSISRPRLDHIIQSLRQKGLISISRTAYSDAWISLSGKGKKLVSYIWPETAFA